MKVRRASAGHVYTRKRTYCAIADVRKAFFDVAWRDAVKVGLADLGVTSSAWKMLDDLLTDTSARVAVNGSMSQPWSETAGVRQRSVLGPLLFNILFESTSAAVRAACPGVALGGSGSPRLTLLLYADDLVLLAENPQNLQWALAAIKAWGSSWRFFFWHCYLGVLFQSSRAWSKHGRRLPQISSISHLDRDRQLPTGFRRNLFQSSGPPSTRLLISECCSHIIFGYQVAAMGSSFVAVAYRGSKCSCAR